jgi:hypothetical protein
MEQAIEAAEAIAERFTRSRETEDDIYRAARVLRDVADLLRLAEEYGPLPEGQGSRFSEIAEQIREDLR